MQMKIVITLFVYTNLSTCSSDNSVRIVSLSQLHSCKKAKKLQKIFGFESKVGFLGERSVKTRKDSTSSLFFIK